MQSRQYLLRKNNVPRAASAAPNNTIDMSKLKVLHIIDSAVPNSIPWFYTMLENLTDTDNYLSWWGTTDLNYFKQKYKTLPPSLAAIPDAASIQERIPR